MKTFPVMFIGERVSWRGKVIQVFKDKKGEEHVFSGIKNLWFGSVYKIEDNKMSVKPTPIESDWKPTEKDEIEYESQKIVVRAHRQSKLKALKLKKPHANIARAVELIRPFYWHLPSLDRRRFLEWFENEISKKVKKK